MIRSKYWEALLIAIRSPLQPIFFTTSFGRWDLTRLGILADKIGFKKIFLSGLVLFACTYAGFAFNPSIAAIFILFGVYGLFSAATDGVSKAWITNIAHDKNTATAVGFYTSCQSICTLGASTIAGLVWEHLGSFYTFISTAAIAFLVFVFLGLKLKNE